MRIGDREIEGLRNRSAEMVLEAVEALAGAGAVCPCETCVLDLAAFALNRVTPRYSTCLLEPVHPEEGRERRIRIEIELALAAGVKRLKEHPHHA